MNPTRHELRPGVWLDARRALFLETAGVLCVADLHLGYSWAHRHAGQMMPLKPEDALERLRTLACCYSPRRLTVLGDIIHRQVPSPAPIAELREFAARVNDFAELDLVTGNHDRGIERALGPRTLLHPRLDLEGYSLVHGDQPVEAPAGTVIMGHEHPAMVLGDGVRSAKFPCFVCGPDLIILPAFSQWAAGTDIRRNPFMSPIARGARLNRAVVIMGDKLLPVPIASVQG